MHDLSAVIVVLCAIGFVSGAAIVAHGIVRWREARGPRRDPRATAASDRWPIAELPEHTPCRVIGEVAPTARAVIAPLSGRSCVYYRVRVSELIARPGIGARHLRDWRPLIDEQRGVGFVLDDGSGRIAIDPADAAIELTTATRRDTTGADLGRDEAALLRRHRVSPLDGLGQPRRLRFEQVAIEIGQSVAATGCCARDAADSTTDLWGLRPPSTELRMTMSRVTDALTPGSPAKTQGIPAIGPEAPASPSQAV